MAFAITCPHCQAKLKSNNAPSAGRKMRCPQCRASFVPGETAGTPPSRAWLPWAIAGGAAAAAVAIIVVWIATRPAPTSVTPVALDGSKKTDVETKKDEPKKDEPKKDEPKKDEPKNDSDKKSEDYDKQKQEYVRFMVEGGIASRTKNFEEAAAAYAAALKLFPRDPDAVAKLGEAKTALDVILKAKQADDKAKLDLDTLIVKAQQSLELKQYAAATDLFKIALEKSPSDERALKGFAAAREAQAKSQDDDKKNTTFAANLDSGKTAMRQGRYADAIRDFIAAQRLDPLNPVPGLLQKEAEKALDNLKNDAEKKAEFQRLLDQASAASKNQRYDDADQAYRQALKLYPNDAIALRGLSDNQDASKAARSQFDSLMTQGNIAMQGGRYRDAGNAFRDALRLLPGNDAATKALRDADRFAENIGIYQQAMNRATASVALKRWLDAAAAYRDALVAIPNDPAALQGLSDAQAALNIEANLRRDFDKYANNGVALLKSQRYPEAAGEFNKALKIYPNHPQADLVARNYRYADAMGRGTAALNGKRFDDAIRAFQAAVQEIPDDYAANAALIRARANNNNPSVKKL